MGRDGAGRQHTDHAVSVSEGSIWASMGQGKGGARRGQGAGGGCRGAGGVKQGGAQTGHVVGEHEDQAADHILVAELAAIFDCHFPETACDQVLGQSQALPNTNAAQPPPCPYNQARGTEDSDFSTVPAERETMPHLTTLDQRHTFVTTNTPEPTRPPCMPATKQEKQE